MDLAPLSRYSERPATELTHVVSQPVFDVARFVEATIHQCLEPRLGSWARNRGHACLPLGSDFRIGRQACDIDQVFGLRDGLFVERSNPHRPRANELIELSLEQP